MTKASTWEMEGARRIGGEGEHDFGGGVKRAGNRPESSMNIRVNRVRRLRYALSKPRESE